jgi:hypothetical protein
LREVHPVFRKISLDATRMLMKCGKVRVLQDETLFEKDEEHKTQFYLILYGWAVVRDKSYFGPGSFIGTEWIYVKKEELVREYKCEI